MNLMVNIATHGKGEGADVPRFMLNGISLDHMNLKIGVGSLAKRLGQIWFAKI